MKADVVGVDAVVYSSFIRLLVDGPAAAEELTSFKSSLETSPIADDSRNFTRAVN